jgi:hypothetical protein
MVKLCVFPRFSADVIFSALRLRLPDPMLSSTDIKSKTDCCGRIASGDRRNVPGNPLVLSHERESGRFTNKCNCFPGLDRE